MFWTPKLVVPLPEPVLAGLKPQPLILSFKKKIKKNQQLALKKSNSHAEFVFALSNFITTKKENFNLSKWKVL